MENLCFESTDAGSDDTGVGVECLFAEEGDCEGWPARWHLIQNDNRIARPCLILSLLSVSPLAATMKRNNPLPSASRLPFLLEGDNVIPKTIYNKVIL